MMEIFCFGERMIDGLNIEINAERRRVDIQEHIIYKHISAYWVNAIVSLHSPWGLNYITTNILLNSVKNI